MASFWMWGGPDAGSRRSVPQLRTRNTRGRRNGEGGIGCKPGNCNALATLPTFLSNTSVKENEHRLNTTMKCSIDGKITRMPYVGTGDNETLPWKQVLSKVEQLIPMMQSRANGGSLCEFGSSTTACI